jgi:hypothetical protein
MSQQYKMPQEEATEFASGNVAGALNWAKLALSDPSEDAQEYASSAAEMSTDVGMVCLITAIYVPVVMRQIGDQTNAILDQFRPVPEGSEPYLDRERNPVRFWVFWP